VKTPARSPAPRPAPAGLRLFLPFSAGDGWDDTGLGKNLRRVTGSSAAPSPGAGTSCETELRWLLETLQTQAASQTEFTACVWFSSVDGV